VHAADFHVIHAHLGDEGVFMPVVATGMTWKATLEGGTITIESGPLAGGSSDRWDISVSQITGVKFEKAGWLKWGKLTLLGPDLHHPLRHLWMKEPNVLDFTRHEQPQFVALRDAIAEAMRIRPPS
jgi:hypothetical protein